MNKQVFAAVDLGASSGRVLGGTFDGRRMGLEEIHRFENGPVIAGDHMHWDLLRQWQHVQDGLRAAAERYGSGIASIGVDTWGVDFGLLGRNDELLGNPYHYRDRRTTGMMEHAFRRVSREEIFAQTGLQFMEINSLYQLLAMQRQRSPLLEVAETFLMIPDLFHWLLTGEKANEHTNASTSQCYSPQAQTWAADLLQKLELPVHIFGRLAEPGTRLGTLRPSVREQTGLGPCAVVLPGTHDTASAVLAVPVKPNIALDWCYISSGTWSLMGVEVPAPVINDTCRRLNFTNEGGVGGTTRLLKNIAGLWLVQECRRIWAQQGREYEWSALIAMAEQSAPLVAVIDPDDTRFLAPKDMPAAIAAYCRDTGQQTPQSDGAIVRCALESLALRYRLVLQWLEELTGKSLASIHIVGGGAQNGLLCQMAADACNRRVLAGPVEATALGNVLMQAIASGEVGTIRDARHVVAESFEVEQYEPRSTGPWDEAFEVFQRLVARSG